MVLTGKFADHLPLNRQSEADAREGIDLDVSTLADWVGACAATLAPLVALIRAHVLARTRIHGDETTAPVLAKGKTTTGRLWTYVRDDRLFGGDLPGPITEAGCWAHARRKFFELAELGQAPLAVEAVRRIDAIFTAERAINGKSADRSRAARQTMIAPLVAHLEDWMRTTRAKLSRMPMSPARRTIC
jgi:transposase